MLGVINRQASLAGPRLSPSATRLFAALAGVLCLAGGLPGFARAADVLTVEGTALEPILIQPGTMADIRRTVALGGDQPSATYVTARSAAGANLVRTRQGYWLPWSGREADLVDAGFAAQSGALEFKLAKESLPASQLPITVSIGYRTATGVKFGMFEVRAR